MSDFLVDIKTSQGYRNPKLENMDPVFSRLLSRFPSNVELNSFCLVIFILLFKLLEYSYKFFQWHPDLQNEQFTA